jgi:hypothetical protein
MITSALSLLVRTDKLNKQELIQFLQWVRNELRPHIDKFTLPKLSELGCVHSEENAIQYHLLSDDKPVDLGMPLSTHAIAYFVDSGRCSHKRPSRTQIVWALTKSLEWVIMEVSIELVASKAEGMTRERAAQVKTSEAPSLEEMLKTAGVTPLQVWHSIKCQIDVWKARQDAQHRQICSIAGRFDTYDLLFNQISLRSSSLD